MSEPMILPDLVKSAPEVTSLASADRVLLTDADGNFKRITSVNLDNQNVMKSLTAPAGKWSRIAMLRTNLSSVGLIAISTSSYPSQSVLIGISTQRTGILEQGNLHILSSVGENAANLNITKIRMSGKGSSSYGVAIDVFANKACAMEVKMFGIGITLKDDLDVEQYGNPNFEYNLPYNKYLGGG